MKIALSNCEGFIVTKCNIVCINFGDDFQQKYFVERSCASLLERSVDTELKIDAAAGTAWNRVFAPCNSCLLFGRQFLWPP